MQVVGDAHADTVAFLAATEAESDVLTTSMKETKKGVEVASQTPSTLSQKDEELEDILAEILRTRVRELDEEIDEMRDAGTQAETARARLGQFNARPRNWPEERAKVLARWRELEQKAQTLLEGL